MIIDADKPSLIFDGNLTVLSTCRSCGEIMQATRFGQTVHPTCPPKPRKIEVLSHQWCQTLNIGDERGAAIIEAQIRDFQTREQEKPALHAAAMLYARWGWPVFPLIPKTKRPACVHGFLDATTDLAKIDHWWGRNPQLNIGLATGHMFDVLDQDTHGWKTFTELLAAHKIPQCHGIVTTASGGLHLYLKTRGQTRVNKARVCGSLVPGIDWRTEGGYVVAPPSTLGGRGRSWSWMFVPSPHIKAAQ